MNIGNVLRAEISRLARKEVRAEVESLKKAAGRYRSEIARLKKEVADLERSIRAFGKAQAQPRAREVEENALRFRSGGLSAHRARLGLSAKDMGLLLGVSALTVYNWEKGVTRPRAAQLPAIAAVRGLGKRQAAARLAELKGEVEA